MTETAMGMMLTVVMSVTEALNDTKFISRINGDTWMKLNSYGIHIRSYQVTYKILL
jgi:hypothetical protein